MYIFEVTCNQHDTNTATTMATYFAIPDLLINNFIWVV